MKRTVLSAVLAGAVCLGAAGISGAHEHELKQQVKVLKIANKAGLSTEDTVKLMNALLEHQGKIAAHEAKRAELAAALKTGEGDLAALKQLDKDILAAQQAAAEALGAGQSAKVQGYLYLAFTGAPAAPAAAPAAEVKTAAADPEAQIRAAVDVWMKGIEAHDIEAAMSVFADDFEHWEYGNRAGLADFIGMAMDMGYLEGVEVHTEDAEIEFKDGEAIVYPVDVTAAFGSVTFEFTFEERDGEWRITYLEAEGI